jgi:lipopolysaccharide export system permease protein
VLAAELPEFRRFVKIINRYVLREHVGPLLFALTALTSLLLLNYIAKRFGQLVGKGLEWSVIAEFFFLSVPFTVAMTIPMAVLVAVLYAFSRLAAENEITAFKASGVSVRRLLAPVLLAACVLAVLMIGFNDQVLPRANYRLSILQGDIFRKKPTLALRARVINRVGDGKLWIRANRIDPSGGMREVVIYNFSNPERPNTVFADSGTLGMTPDQRDLALVLFTGTVEEYPRAEPGRVQRTRFTRNQVMVRDVGNQLERSEGEQAKGDREMTICEMQARYDQQAKEYAVLNRRLDSLAAAARRAGQEVALPRRSTTYSENGLGALYCRLLRRLDVPVAFAATVQDSVTPVPGKPRLPAPTPDAAAARAAPAGLTAGAAAIIDAISVQAELSRDSLNQFDVEIQKKFALAVACVIFVLLGAPIALRFPRGGVGLVIGVSLGVFATYYVCLIAGETVADKGYLPPFAAMWAANVIFGLVGLVLLVRMGREGATARGGDMGELLDGLRSRLARLARGVGVPAERRRVG